MGDRTGNAEGFAASTDVFSSQFDDLTPAQSAPCRDQHKSREPIRHRSAKGCDFGN